jgi:hypothetical protein
MPDRESNRPPLGSARPTNGHRALPDFDCHCLAGEPMMSPRVTSLEGRSMHRTLLAIALATAASIGAAAQSHTIIALGHGDFSVNELDPSTGRILHVFKAANQPHEAAISPDGTTIYVMVSSTSDVVVVDLATQRIVSRWKAGEDTFGGGLRLTGGRPTVRR